MSEEVKRFDALGDSAVGPYMLFEDYERILKSTLQALADTAKQLRALEDAILDMYTCDYYDKIMQLQEKIREARKQG